MKIIGKLLLGLLSVVPLVFFGFFFFWLLPSFFSPSALPNGRSEYTTRFDMVIPFAIGTSVLLIVLLIVYSILLARRPDVQIGEKIGVPLGIFISNGILLPLVWWLYVWRESNLASISRPRAV